MLYSGDSTMMIVTFKEPTSSMRTMNAISKIKKYTKDDCYLGGMSAISEDTKDQTEHDTPIYAGIAVVLCIRIREYDCSSCIYVRNDFPNRL